LLEALDRLLQVGRVVAHDVPHADARDGTSRRRDLPQVALADPEEARGIARREESTLPGLLLVELVPSGQPWRGLGRGALLRLASPDVGGLVACGQELEHRLGKAVRCGGLSGSWLHG
jgi:hypothetical protein